MGHLLITPPPGEKLKMNIHALQVKCLAKSYNLDFKLQV